MKKYRNLIFGILSTLIMIVFLFALVNWVVMPIYTLHWSEKELPDLTEKTYEEARDILKSKGFQIIRDGEQNNAVYPENTIISQHPAPFTKVKKGRRIYVIVSAGEKRVTVPKVEGVSERDARFILRQAGLRLGEVYYEYDNYQPQGVVCGQSLEEGVETAQETIVDIYVSNGRLPTRFFVPDIVGKSLIRAKQMIRYAGLEVGELVYEAHPELVPETVLMQSLGANEEVAQKTPIDLVISTLPDSMLTGPIPGESHEPN